MGVPATDDFVGEPTFVADVEGRRVRGRLGVDGSASPGVVRVPSKRGKGGTGLAGLETFEARPVTAAWNAAIAVSSSVALVVRFLGVVAIPA